MDYQGYSNYATWNVDLWFDNERLAHDSKWELLNSLEEGEIVTADDVKQLFSECFGRRTPDVSILGMRQVNWQELALQWQDELEEEKVYRDQDWNELGEMLGEMFD